MTDGWRPDLSKSDKPKYLAIATALSDDIAAGRLIAGSRLPPQRDLAARLGVDLTTVTKAYDVARGQGLIEARGRAGSFVIGAARLGDAARGPIDTGMNMPPEAIGGSLFSMIERTTAQLMRSPDAFAHLQYQPAGGMPRDREAGVRLLASRDLPALVDQVIVTAGGQNALHAIAATLFEPGDVVACGQYVYPGFLGIAQRLGLKLVPLAAISADALEAACTANPVRALYVVPTNDNPTGITLDLSERQAIAEVAERFGLQIIEDDAYGQLPADGPPPIASAAPDRTWHIASTSKIISPALRVAHVRAPSVRAALRMSADIHETTVMAPSLNAAIVSAWVQDGSFVRLVGETRTEGRWRQQLARSILGDAACSGHPDGYHFWLPLADELHLADLVNLLRPMGLSVVGSDGFAVGDARGNALRVSLGGGIDRARLARALQVLEAHLEPQGKRSLTI
jgi:DNA-binding transcriptional MocR family regulator